MSRLPSILLLILITVQASLAPLAGRGIAFCAGGGHEHSAAEVAPQRCDLACDHDSAWLVPRSVESDHDCECSDVELTLADLLRALKVGSDDVLDLLPAPAILHEAWLQTPTDTRRPAAWYAWREWDDPGGKRRLASIRTTRLVL